MKRFAETAEAISRTSSRLKKVSALAEYLRELSDDDLRVTAIFFTGKPFPLADARTLNVGGAALVQVVQQIAGASDQDIHNSYLQHGDLGDAARMLLPPADKSVVTPSQLYAIFEQLASTQGVSPKHSLLKGLFQKLTPEEGQYVIKIITGDLRIGLKESTVEEAIAKAFAQPADMVRRTNMSLGDIGETAVLARHGKMEDAGLRLFRPIKFMLATPAENEEEIFSNFAAAFYVEDKYDGIRGQLHVESSRAALYSRTLDEVSGQFPEIVLAAKDLKDSVIVDGEVVAYRDGIVLPFAMLQKRLGRRTIPSELIKGHSCCFHDF